MRHENKIYDHLTSLFRSHNEWLLVHDLGQSFSLRSNEFELEQLTDKVLFSFLDANGFQTWRIVEAEIKDERVSLELTRNFRKEEILISLIPRAKAEILGEAVELARLEKANEIAELILCEIQNTKLIRVELNKENGRFAQIILENSRGKQIAALSDVSSSLTPEVLLSSSIIWLSRLRRRKKNPINEIWILSEKRVFKNLRRLHACLSENWKKSIRIKEISRKGAKKQRKNKSAEIVELKPLQIQNLWIYKPTKLYLAKDSTLSETAKEVVKLAPGKIDHVFSKNGETLRYLGLPFLRTRKIFGEEKTWFGIDNNRRVLRKESYEEFYELIENLKNYRSFDSPNKQHVFYDSAPEAWLESILRQNIKLLDANLILSPIYNQFRTSRDKIDLLALRKDGRLIIIELKVSPDREMIFQSVDYWRKIELQRRKGKLEAGRLFGNKKIADKPAIIYLVAPTLSYHRDFYLLSKTVSSEIEICRFDLGEKWREELKVLARRKLTG